MDYCGHSGVRGRGHGHSGAWGREQEEQNRDVIEADPEGLCSQWLLFAKKTILRARVEKGDEGKMGSRKVFYRSRVVI